MSSPSSSPSSLSLSSICCSALCVRRPPETKSLALPLSFAPIPANTPRLVICGAGVIGVCIAYYLTLRGLRPLLVERSCPAAAASGKAAGFLASHWHSPLSPRGPLMRRSFALHCELAKILDGAANYGFRRIGALGLTVPEPRVPLSQSDQQRLAEVQA
jgi:glycine/D-amino acid oxidase-like deaminating enzyme